jgi:hypothetical protein
MKDKQFQIALSFAGEDRTYVDQVANLLKNSGVSIFYDIFEEANIWGKNLYDYLTDVYQNKAQYTIMFISKYYAQKLWTNHERQAMQARAFQENQEYILPVRFDDTTINGVLPTIGHIDLRKYSPEEFVEIVRKKLVLTGESIPSEKFRNSVFSIDNLLKSNPSISTVKVENSSGKPINNIVITAIAQNDTYKEAITNDDGIAIIDISTRRLYTLLISNKDYPCAIMRDWDPVDDMKIVLQESEKIGSIVCHSTCHIPGLNGRLNIILDTSMRTYLYADNISINGGMQQPATFQIGIPFTLEDSDGVVMEITVMHIQGRTSLVQYIHI